MEAQEKEISLKEFYSKYVKIDGKSPVVRDIDNEIFDMAEKAKVENCILSFRNGKFLLIKQ